MKERIIQLNRAERKYLKRTHRTVTDKKAADRIKAVILLDAGYTQQETAKILLLDRDTIRRQVASYRQGGVEQLLSDNCVGYKGLLSSQQKKQLKRELRDKLFSTAQVVRSHVRQKYGVSYTLDGIIKLLHRLGFSYKKTKGAPAKADREKQEAFVKEYTQTRSKLQKNEKIYFMDAMHPIHNSRPDYAWIEKGTERSIKTISARNRLNINGVYSPCDQETIVRSSRTINAQSTLILLREIRRKHPDLERIIVIHDNARSNHSRWLRARLPKGIEMRALPAYSPNLNLIERLWKLFRKEVMSNRYHASYERFKHVSANFFRSLRGRKAQLATLMAENFQILDSS